MRGNETPYPICIKFCMVGIPDVITYANFGDDRLRGLGMAGGSNFAVPHRPSSSSLQHTRTTMLVCDIFLREQDQF